jgi:hypothetical protein
MTCISRVPSDGRAKDGWTDWSLVAAGSLDSIVALHILVLAKDSIKSQDIRHTGRWRLSNTQAKSGQPNCEWSHLAPI